MLDLVERPLFVAGHPLTLQVPRDPETLLSEEAFAVDEFLPYWAELWPSALALAEACKEHARRVFCIEIGAGLGVPSIVAALNGADVVATDWSADAVALLEENAARNGAQLRVVQWSWTDDPAPLGGPFDLVLGADVLYEARNAEQLVAALPRLGDEAWIADPGRPNAPAFLEALHWTADQIPHAGPPSVAVHRLRRPTAPSG